ncbi:hypothetical protein COLO4_11386 [Corchorus olitorius]|uniref:Uncharacterized protein n=1 Tax=Corchorus olitorius TaxID=93759 RepID=A0A1R3K4Q9_9ROSI|nr:hypothetical protein COLO4_11386 [Corchorus olitorius]
MANLKGSYLVFLLIVLISSHELLFTQGRILEVKNNVGENVNIFSPDGMRINAGRGRKPNSLHLVLRSLEEYVEAFRPTTPGHSPGVGHSIQH